MSQVVDEVCANCGNRIGKLETPEIWDDAVVCPDCHDKLAGRAAREIAAEADTVARLAPPPPPPRIPVATKAVAPGSGLRTWGAVVAVVGTVATVLGYRLYAPGIFDWAAMLLLLGILSTLVGLLMFGIGRLIQR